MEATEQTLVNALPEIEKGPIQELGHCPNSELLPVHIKRLVFLGQR